MNFICFLLCFLCHLILIHAARVSSCHSDTSSSVTIQLQRPRQFLMDIYTRPYRQGLVQHMRVDAGGKYK
jgi:hypothetical protein